MDEVLNKILNSELLTEDNRKELQAAILSQVEEAKQVAREQAIVEAKAEYAQEFVSAKEALVEALDTKVQAFLVKEMKEFEDDVNRFRDLEAEYAERLIEAKEELARQFEAEKQQLVDNLDVFLEMRLSAEFSELRESIEEVKKNEFGRKIFEAYAQEYNAKYVDENEVNQQLEETKKSLEEAKKQLTESKKALEKVERDAELKKVLESLAGRPREIMEAILKSVPTNKLQEAYNTFIGKVISESVKQGETVEKDNAGNAPVLAEGQSVKADDVKTSIVTGNENDDKTQQQSQISEAHKAQLMKLAGMLKG